jgi:uncharacterized damage-inducible protein DinB
VIVKEKTMTQQPPVLQVFGENWRLFNDKLRACVAPLTDEQLTLQPAPGMWPLGQLLQHIVSVRAGWFYFTLQEHDPAIEPYTWWGQRESPARSGAELARGLDDTWAYIESRLHGWTPDDLAATFPDEGDDGLVTQVSRAWVVYHVLEHDLFHGGEVSSLLGSKRLQAIDL